MNKSYKVVFSKARGALMVVNELTSSVQAKGTKTVVATVAAALMAGAAMSAEPQTEEEAGGSQAQTSVTIQGQMENVVVKAGQTGTISNPAGVEAGMTTTVNGLTLSSATTEPQAAAATAAGTGVNLNLAGTSNFASGTLLKLEKSAQEGGELTLLDGAVVNNEGAVQVDTLTLKGTLNTGLAYTVKDNANHVKFETLNLEKGGKLNITGIGDVALSMMEEVSAEKAGTEDPAKPKNVYLTFSDGTINLKGGEFAVGENGVLTASDEAKTKYDFTTDGKLNVAVKGINNGATVNFSVGDYNFGKVKASGKSSMMLDGANVSVVDLALDGATVEAELKKGTFTADTVTSTDATVTLTGASLTVNKTLDIRSGTFGMTSGELAVGELKSAGTTTLTEGTLSFIEAPAAKVEEEEKTYDVTVSDDVTTFGADLVVASPITVEVSGGTLSIQNDLVVTDMKLAGAVNVDGNLTLDGVLAGGAASGVTITEDAQLNLTKNTKFVGADGTGAATVGVILVNGTVSTDSSFFKTDDAAEPTDRGYEANTALNLATGTVSFTDASMNLADLKSLNTVLNAEALEVLADEITDTNEDGVTTAVTELNVTDWADIGGATLKTVSATMTSSKAASGIASTIGAKNVILTDAVVAEGSTPATEANLKVNGGHLTLVGGAKGTQLVAGRTADEDSVPVELSAGTLTLTSGSLTFGAANAAQKTFGTYNGNVDVADGGKFTVQNGEFDLTQGLKNAGTTDVNEGAVLAVKDVVVPAQGQQPASTTASLENSGTMTVTGTVFAETVKNTADTFTVNGKLVMNDFASDSTVGISVTGIEAGHASLVMTGTEPKSTKAEAEDAGLSFNIANGTKLSGGALLVAGNYEGAAEAAYAEAVAVAEAEAEAETEAAKVNMIFVGERSTFANAAEVGDGASDASDDYLVIDAQSVAQKGFVANGEKAQQIVTVGAGDGIAVDTVKVLNLNQNVVTTNSEGKKFLAVGDVTAAAVDFGTAFYKANAVNVEGLAAIEVNEYELNDVKSLSLNSIGAVESSLKNVAFGQNVIADEIIFSAWEKLDAEGSKSVFEAAKAQGLLIEGATLENFETKVKGDSRAAFEALEEAIWSKYAADFRAAEHAATNMAAYGGAFSAAVDASNEFAKVVDRRMTLGNANVKREANALTAWADVYSTWNGADSLYGASGYEADVYGAAMGFDWVAPCNAVIGAAFTVGQADSNSVDAAYKVDNDADFWGLSVYGSHQIGNVNAKADLGYVSISNDLSTASGYFGSLKESLDASVFTFGLGAEYLVDAGSFNVVPHAGIRWSRIDMDDSSFGADYDAMNLFQMPIGVTFSGAFETASWTFAPMVDLSVVPAFGDKDAVATYVGGVSETIRVVDTNPIQATLGLSATTGDWTFGINYGLTAGGDDRMNNAFNATARYTF